MELLHKLPFYLVQVVYCLILPLSLDVEHISAKFNSSLKKRVRADI